MPLDRSAHASRYSAIGSRVAPRLNALGPAGRVVWYPTPRAHAVGYGDVTLVTQWFTAWMQEQLVR